MTRRLSGIWHAWHFQFALGSVVTAMCGSFYIACLHPLTQRYTAPSSNKVIAYVESITKFN
ncbi:DUF3265 domain-containing protein [Vibrio parahaemolyticus]|nr:DUF3265 domain-containing protein [Vibrio parahaemolyticus]